VRRPTGLGLIALVVLGFLYLPIVVVVANAFNADRTLTHWGGLTTHWFAVAFGDSATWAALWASVRIALVSTTISLLIAVPAGLWARRATFRGRAVLDGTTYVRIILPEIVAAVGLFLLFRRFDLGLGMWTVVVGHVVFNSAYATIVIQARMATLSTTLEEAAADLGANRWRVFRRVTLPLLMPAVVVSALLCLTFSLDDVITSQFLGGTDAQTLPVLVLGKIRLHVTPEVNAIGTGLMLITLLTFLIAGLITLLRPTGAGGMLGLGRKAAE
jgi:ABC-type spermidine/putrescine transport system permease subunit II